MKLMAKRAVAFSGKGNRRSEVRSNSGDVVSVKLAPITKSDRKIIQDIVRWEDESATSDLTISGVWKSRVAPQ